MRRGERGARQSCQVFVGTASASDAAMYNRNKAHPSTVLACHAYSAITAAAVNNDDLEDVLLLAYSAGEGWRRIGTIWIYRCPLVVLSGYYQTA